MARSAPGPALAEAPKCFRCRKEAKTIGGSDNVVEVPRGYASARFTFSIASSISAVFL